MVEKSRTGSRYRRGTGWLVRQPPGFEALVEYRLEAWREALDGEPGQWGYSLNLEVLPDPRGLTPAMSLPRFGGTVNGQDVPVLFRFDGYEEVVALSNVGGGRATLHFDHPDAALARVFPGLF